MTARRVILASGGFWGAQEVLRRPTGVIATRTGYSGGDTPNAVARDHGNHAESVEVVFEDSVISFRALLEFFFRVHDPTTLNRQGDNVGPAFRSAIFYTSEQQKRIALDTIEDIEASGRWPGAIVTEVAPAGVFWEAEPENQDFLRKHVFGYTCHCVRPEWVLTRPSEPSEEKTRSVWNCNGER